MSYTTEEIRAMLKGTPKKELYNLAKQLDVLEKKLNLSGPQTDDELHQWILDAFNINIPRVAVCEGHIAPFTFLADIYFGRSTSALAMACRGGAKTFMVALLHRVNAEFKVKVESLTAGATEAQSKRCFAHLDALVKTRGENNISSKKVTEIVWTNGCKTEIVAGTMAAVNGPHPQVVHLDEVELMDPMVLQEAKNMAQSKMINGQLVPAQEILTSTRKRAIGQMQTMLDEINAAKILGNKPMYDLYTWCIFEIAQPQKGCMIANPDAEGGYSPCGCDNISKGTWDDDTPRYLSDICQGRFARSDGWVTWDDVVRLFMSNERSTWEAQQQCTKPSTEDIVLPRFSVERNGIVDFQPDPANGPIYQGIDFGSTNPNAVLWWQVLKYDVAAKGISGQEIVLKEGSRVAFDEFYKAEIPNYFLANNILRKERLWKDIYRDFRVKGRFADPQGAQARRDLANHSPTKILTQWHTSRDVRDQIKVVKELIDNKKFYVDVQKCPRMIDEIQVWHYPKIKIGMQDDPEIPVDDFDHAMSAMRYCLSNVSFLEDGKKGKALPSAVQRGQEANKNLQNIRDRLPSSSGDRSIPTTEKWRLELGSGPMRGL